ncbi:MAG TPA: hypothetical protein VMH92_01395 [Acidocella sp.]|nr:hypothetical protein [Acidocella sp.]
MSESENAIEPPKVEAPPALPVAPVAPKPRRAAWPYFFALGFVALAAGEVYLWTQGQAHRADATELAVLRAQMDDLRAAQSRATPPPDSVTVQADLTQKYAALAAQLNAVQAQAAQDHGALSMLQANAVDLGKLTQRMALLNALGTARLALDEGQPLGQIPGAPPELAQFATQAPPTMAQLRDAFAPAAKAAEAASLGDNGQVSFWARVRARLEGLMTISDGDHVVFGPPAAAALNNARLALDNDDLAGAVAALRDLGPGAKDAMAGWISQAQALLAAKAALLSLAQGA